MKTRLVLLAALTIFAVPSCVLAAENSAVSLPRYRLDPGEKISYTLTYQSAGADNSSKESATVDFTVLRENPDGSRHLLMHTHSTSESSYRKGQAPTNDSYKLADLFPDGHPVDDHKGAGGLSMSIYFPHLPPDMASITTGWQFAEPARQLTEIFKPISNTSSEFVFSSTQDGMLRKIYLITRDTEFHFDRARGLISHAAGTNSQDYGFHNKGTATLDLQSAQPQDAGAVAQLGADFDLLLGEHEYYAPLKDAKTPQQIDAAIAKVKKSLQSVADSVKTDAVKQQFADRIRSLDDEASYYKSAAEDRAKLLDKPSIDWSSTALNGKPVALSSFKGKIVVMDFWYRGCGWCMYATPAVKQLAEDYKDKGVVVLGMNADREDADACFVADAFSLPYPIIKAKEIADKYNIHGFPTLLIVDQSGVIRDMHDGYTPASSRADVGKKIDELLSAAK